MANERDFVELGISCANICQALQRGTNGKRLNNLSKSVRGAMEKLTM